MDDQGSNTVDARSHPQAITEEEKELFTTRALWCRQKPRFLDKDKDRRMKIKACVNGIYHAYVIARRTRGNMSDTLRDDSCRLKLLQFALYILTLKKYSETLTARVASLSLKYETTQNVYAHASPSEGLVEGHGVSGEGKCIACSLTVSHPMTMQHALDFLSKIDEEIIAVANNGENEHSARMFNTLLIMKEMLVYFGISCTASKDQPNKIIVTVPHEKGEIVSAEKLCASCQRKSEKAILSCEALDTMTDIARLIRTCLFQLKSHLEWQECLFIGLIDSVHGLFTNDPVSEEPRKVDLGGGTFGLLSMRSTLETEMVERALVETTNNPLGVWFATRPIMGF